MQVELKKNEVIIYWHVSYFATEKQLFLLITHTIFFRFRCVANNNNLTVPVETAIKINVICKFFSLPFLLSQVFNASLGTRAGEPEPEPLEKKTRSQSQSRLEKSQWPEPEPLAGSSALR